VPAFGVVLECLPVFARKPIFSYNAAVIGMFGIGLMSWFVWQHHLFMSGIDPGLRPFFMFSTEMISFPTSIVFFNMVGTLYKGRIRFTTPMLFALAFFFNFLMGGFSGVFLSDVPTDGQLHGSYAVQAHFHFVLMGATVFALFGGTYYWFPKFTGRLMNERLGKIHFWWSWIGFNGTFITLVIVGFMGMPRRVVTYLPELHTANVIASIFALILGIGNIVLLLLSGLVYFWGQIEMRRGAPEKISAYCTLALLLGVGATAFLAASLIHTPFDTRAGGYASVFYGLTRVLGTVLLASLVFMVGLCYRSIKGMYSRENMAVIDAFGEYWGWLIAIGAVSYTLLYILPFLHLE